MRNKKLLLALGVIVVVGCSAVIVGPKLAHAWRVNHVTAIVQAAYSIYTTDKPVSTVINSYVQRGDTDSEIEHSICVGHKPWTVDPHNPVLRPATIPTEGQKGTLNGQEVETEYPTVVYDGTRFQMWFSSDRASQSWGISYADSPDGVTWTKRGVVLDFSQGGTWDRNGVAFPKVIYDPAAPIEERYKMWYAGLGALGDDTTNHYRIGYATSPDGRAWTKRGMVIDRGPDETGVLDPAVVHDPSGTWHMWYVAASTKLGQVVRHATSVDGLNWQLASDPVVSYDPDGDGISNVYTLSVIYDRGWYRMWFFAHQLDKGKIVTGKIMYTRSANGTEWIDPSVFPPALIPQAETNRQVFIQYGPSVIATGDTYRMWYNYFVKTPLWPEGYGAIGYAEKTCP